MIKDTVSIPLDTGLNMDFVLITPGSFMMGSNLFNPDEKPVHRVAITRPFYIGVFAVTQAQWKAITGDNPAGAEFRGDDMPVVHVSWMDCQLFMTRLTERAGEGMICRLPTEAEWEYACRAGSETEYCFGDDVGSLGECAWFGRGGKLHPVGQKKPNAWGLYDMHGNVDERCADWYDVGYYAKSPLKDPKGPATPAGDEIRVIRGGCYCDNNGSALRSAYRGRGTLLARSGNVGCRAVMSALE